MVHRTLNSQFLPLQPCRAAAPASRYGAALFSFLFCCASALAAENLLRNPQFSETENGQPLDWLVHARTNQADIGIRTNPKTGLGNMLSVNVHQPSTRPWDVQLRQAFNRPLTKGTTLQIRFEYRISKDYWFTCYVQQEKGNWQKYIELRIDSPDEKWASCKFTCRVPEDIPAGRSSLCFHLAAAEGQVSFRDMAVRILPQGMDPETVSTSEALVIGGNAVDQLWRRKARARLMKTRRGDLSLRVLQADGTPAGGAEVTLEQTSPLMPIGAVVPIEILAPDIKTPFRPPPTLSQEKRQACRDTIVNSPLFSRILFPRALTWPVFEQLERERIIRLLDELDRHGLAVHGHALYTPAFHFAPPRSRQMNAADLAPAILKHIRTQSAALNGRIPTWTVVDSPLSYHEMYDMIGESILTDAFASAQEASPNARLFLGEDKALTSPADDRLHDFIGLVRWMLQSGVALDGLAVEVAAGRPYLAPQALEGRLQEIGQFVDLPLVIRGLDVDGPTAETQAARLADMLLLFASLPQVEAIYLGELWAPFAERPRNALFDAAFNPSPALKLATRRLMEDWWTRAKGKTATDGTFHAKGFTAAYTVRIEHRGRTVTESFQLEKSGTEVTVRLPAP